MYTMISDFVEATEYSETNFTFPKKCQSITD